MDSNKSRARSKAVLDSRRAEGMELASQLDPWFTREEVGSILGLPQQRIYETELIALWKVKHRILSLRNSHSSS